MKKGNEVMAEPEREPAMEGRVEMEDLIQVEGQMEEVRMTPGEVHRIETTSVAVGQGIQQSLTHRQSHTRGPNTMESGSGSDLHRIPTVDLLGIEGGVPGSGHSDVQTHDPLLSDIADAAASPSNDMPDSSDWIKGLFPPTVRMTNPETRR